MAASVVLPRVRYRSKAPTHERDVSQQSITAGPRAPFRKGRKGREGRKGVCFPAFLTFPERAQDKYCSGQTPAPITPSTTSASVNLIRERDRGRL